MPWRRRRRRSHTPFTHFPLSSLPRFTASLRSDTNPLYSFLNRDETDRVRDSKESTPHHHHAKDAHQVSADLIDPALRSSNSGTPVPAPTTASAPAEKARGKGGRRGAGANAANSNANANANGGGVGGGIGGGGQGGPDEAPPTRIPSPPAGLAPAPSGGHSVPPSHSPSPSVTDRRRGAGSPAGVSVVLRYSIRFLLDFVKRTSLRARLYSVPSFRSYFSGFRALWSDANELTVYRPPRTCSRLRRARRAMLRGVRRFRLAKRRLPREGSLGICMVVSRRSLVSLFHFLSFPGVFVE